MIDELMQRFKCGSHESRNFRYCGKEIAQDDDYTLRVKCKDTTLKMTPIRIAYGRKNGQSINKDERTQLKSVAGSLQWIARQCRPELSYRVSRLQSVAAAATVKDLREANKVMEYARSTCDRGLTFRSDAIN